MSEPIEPIEVDTTEEAVVEESPAAPETTPEGEPSVLRVGG